jgi:hypothetical protein
VTRPSVCSQISRLDGTDDVEFGAERPHQLEALLGEAVGDHDQCAIALRCTHECEGGTRAPARVFDDDVAGRDQAVALCARDHRDRHPVLHRPRGIPVLELQPELRPVRRRTPVQSNERCVADRLEDGVHVVIIVDRDQDIAAVRLFAA